MNRKTVLLEAQKPTAVALTTLTETTSPYLLIGVTYSVTLRKRYER